MVIVLLLGRGEAGKQGVAGGDLGALHETDAAVAAGGGVLGGRLVEVDEHLGVAELAAA